VSLHIGTVLDVEDFIHASYTLEVSSPALSGTLQASGLRAFCRQPGEVETRRAINGSEFSRTPAGTDDADILIDDRTSGRVTIPSK